MRQTAVQVTDADRGLGEILLSSRDLGENEQYSHFSPDGIVAGAIDSLLGDGTLPF
jgi:hypothetical protein